MHRYPFLHVSSLAFGFLITSLILSPGYISHLTFVLPITFPNCHSLFVFMNRKKSYSYPHVDGLRLLSLILSPWICRWPD